MSSRFFMLLMAIVLSGNLPAALASAPKGGIGRLTDLEGEVSIDGQLAVEDAVLKVGSWVETLQGSCTLLLGKETVMRLGEKSRLRITDYLLTDAAKNEKAAVNLDFGRMRALLKTKGSVQKSFNVRSRSAVMGIRGTHIIVDSPQDLSKPQNFMTVEGVAELSLATPKGSAPAEKILLKENESVQAKEGTDSAKPGGKPQVVQLSAAAVQEIAEQVAPAPKDVRAVEESRPAKPGVSLLNPIVTPPVLLDPVANGGGNPVHSTVDVTIEVK